MTRRYMEMLIWDENDDWYYVDYERDRYILTDKAPEEARRSFELWKKFNRVDWDDPPQPRPTHQLTED